MRESIMKVYKALLIGSVLGTISMPTVMADMYNNVDLGTDNTVVANTSANVAVGNMNTTDIWGIAVGSLCIYASLYIHRFNSIDFYQY